MKPRYIISIIFALLAVFVICISLILTQTRIYSLLKLVAYRVTLPTVERGLCSIKRRLSPDVALSSSNAVCDVLEFDQVLRAARRLSPPNALNLTNPNNLKATAAEVVVRAHARLHFRERVSILASTDEADEHLIGENLISQGASTPDCWHADHIPTLGSENSSPTGRLRFFTLQGYGLANVGVLQTEGGFVLIDAAETPDVLKRCMDALTTLQEGCPTPPIVGVLVSHYHTDHVGGLGGVRQWNLEHNHSFEAKLIAHEKTVALVTDYFLQQPQAKYRRAMKQFGTNRYLKLGEMDMAESFSPHQRPEVISAGIGRFLARLTSVEADATNVEFPTHYWRGPKHSLYLNGYEIQMAHLPGETSDQLGFYVPALKLLHAADNFYFAFPNIYPLRGGVFRDPLDWVRSLDVLLDEFVPKTDVMALGHTTAVFGRERVRSLLERYRDSIQFVHDQTIRLMNRMNDADAIATKVADLYWAIFPRSSEQSHLGFDMAAYPLVLADPAMPFYGQIHWAAKAVVFHQRGWFGGSPVEINTHKIQTADRSTRLLRLIEGKMELTSAVLMALDEGECQWALELTQLYLSSYGQGDGTINAKDVERAKLCKAADLDKIHWQEYDLKPNEAKALQRIYGEWKMGLCEKVAGGVDIEGTAKDTGVNESTTCPVLTKDRSWKTPAYDLDDRNRRPFYKCLQKEALWCLARRELSSSSRNWYLAESLTDQEKQMEELENARIALTLRNQFLATVPDLVAVVKSFPVRFEPTLISFGRTVFRLHLVSNDEPRPAKQGILSPVLSNGNKTLEIVSRNSILMVREVRENSPRRAEGSEFVEIYMTYEALRLVLLKTYPAGPIRLLLEGSIWFGSGPGILSRFRQFCKLLELFLAVEHE